MNPELISPAVFWYNHLTYEQRAFIMEYQNKQGDVNLTKAYDMKEQFHTMPGWPETPMRQV